MIRSKNRLRLKAMRSLKVQNYIWLIVLLSSCELSNSKDIDTKDSAISDTVLMYDSLAYDLNSPKRILIPSSELKEISGLSFDTDSQRLLAINDEKGRLYSLSTENAETVNSYKFAKSGDYEGVELIGDSVFVVKSNGQIYGFHKNANSESRKYNTELNSSNDIEGLGTSADGYNLILACKADPWIGSNDTERKTRALYLFDRKLNKLLSDPLVLIHQDSLIAYVESRDDFNTLSKSGKKKRINRVKEFAPSAIATHPVTKEMYVLSSRGKLLLILNSDGSIRTLNLLSATHTQPEGLCFDDKANLYISNEAKGLSPKIFVYEFSSN